MEVTLPRVKFGLDWIGASYRDPMSASFPGSLIKTDVPAKQLILYLNEENERKIVIRELDEKTLFIDTRYVDYVRQEVARLFELNVFEVTRDLPK